MFLTFLVARPQWLFAMRGPCNVLQLHAVWSCREAQREVGGNGAGQKMLKRCIPFLQGWFPSSHWGYEYSIIFDYINVYSIRSENWVIIWYLLVTVIKNYRWSRGWLQKEFATNDGERERERERGRERETEKKRRHCTLSRKDKAKVIVGRKLVVCAETSSLKSFTLGASHVLDIHMYVYKEL